LWAGIGGTAPGLVEGWGDGGWLALGGMVDCWGMAVWDGTFGACRGQ